MNLADYPANWRAISKRIRFGRAGGRCECRGECGTDHLGRCAELHGMSPESFRGRMVVLTTAHLDHDTQSDDPANLRAMCQACHLRYDRDRHAETRARNAGSGVGSERAGGVDRGPDHALRDAERGGQPGELVAVDPAAVRGAHPAVEAGSVQPGLVRPPADGLGAGSGADEVFEGGAGLPSHVGQLGTGSDPGPGSGVV